MRCDMRLIDADVLYEKTAEWEAQALAQVERYNPTDSRDKWLRWSYVLKERSAFKFDVADAPIIDAVEVVRCKDCKRRQEDTIFHKLYCDGREVVADGYCWKGEQDD